jgi:hypothetical protein
MLLNLSDADSQPYSGRTGDAVIGNSPKPALQQSPIKNEDQRLLKVSDPTGEYLRLLLPGHHHTQEPGQPELPSGAG